MIRPRDLSEPTVRIPGDPLLAGLVVLLDGRLFAQAAAALLPATARVVGCRSWYVRYKPRTNAIAVHELHLAGESRPLLVHGKCYTEEAFAAARDKAATVHWVTPALARPHVALPDSRVLLFAFPNDQVLDGLRMAANPKRIQRALYAHDDEFPTEQWRISDSRLTITPVRFKPEKRAVLRVDTRAKHRQTGAKHPLRVYLRVHGKGEGRQAADLMQRLHDHFASHATVRAPRPLAYLAEPQVTLVADAGGEPMRWDLSGSQAAGTTLAALHGMKGEDFPVCPEREVLRGVADTAATIAELAPELAGEAEGVAASLDVLAADGDGTAPAFVHGDFHPGQLLKRDDGVVLLDFDRSYGGDPIADLGNYAAHLIFRSLVGSAPDPRPLIAGFHEAYIAATGTRVPPSRLAYWTAVGLLKLAPTPFRSLHPHWPALTAEVLAACRKELM